MVSLRPWGGRTNLDTLRQRTSIARAYTPTMNTTDGPNGQPPPAAVAPVERLTTSSEDELRAFLLEDESRLGDVYRGKQQGQSPDAIAASLGIATYTFVYTYQKMIDAILVRELPTAPTMAEQVARRYRAILKKEWSADVRSRLQEDLARLEKSAADLEAKEDEDIEAKKLTEEAESRDTNGIYVYAFPHYFRYPVDPDSGRTLLKVGHSTRDAILRMREQARTTAVPEEPVLLRIYPTGERGSADVEADFHHLLRAFGAGRNAQRMAGREWFLTTTAALDAVAIALKLEINVVSEQADHLFSV